MQTGNRYRNTDRQTDRQTREKKQMNEYDNITEHSQKRYIAVHREIDRYT